MEGCRDALDSEPRVKTTFFLGSEKFSVRSDTGVISEQISSMKEQSMAILKEYITKHNALTDVPDEVIEGSSDESEEDLDTPSKKSRTQS